MQINKVIKYLADAHGSGKTLNFKTLLTCDKQGYKPDQAF